MSFQGDAEGDRRRRKELIKILLWRDYGSWSSNSNFNLGWGHGDGGGEWRMEAVEGSFPNTIQANQIAPYWLLLFRCNDDEWKDPLIKL